MSQLKKKLGNQCIPIPSLPPVTSAGTFLPKPYAIVERHVRRNGHLPLTEVLVHWEGQQLEDATWEQLESLRLQFPHYVDKVL